MIFLCFYVSVTFVMLRRFTEAITITIISVVAAVFQGMAAAMWMAEETCKLCRNGKKDEPDDTPP